MFIRFVTPARDEAARAEAGLFGAAYHVRSAYRPATAPWQVHEIHREIQWFCEHLAVPTTFSIQVGRPKGARHGVCWFRDTARNHVSRARYLAYLLGEMGVPVEIVTSKTPGTTLWEDTHQVVALPQRDHPRVFH